MIIAIITGIIAGLYLSVRQSAGVFLFIPVVSSIEYFIQLDQWRRLGLLPPEFLIWLASSCGVSFVVFMIFYGVGKGIARLTRKKSGDRSLAVDMDKTD
jgi:hypothetical protein